jgi:hypothetical protein
LWISPGARGYPGPAKDGSHVVLNKTQTGIHQSPFCFPLTLHFAHSGILTIFKTVGYCFAFLTQTPTESSTRTHRVTYVNLTTVLTIPEQPICTGVPLFLLPHLRPFYLDSALLTSFLSPGQRGHYECSDSQLAYWRPWKAPPDAIVST